MKTKLVIKKSTIPRAGKGLFTETPIKRGTKIVEYKGKISTWAEADHDDGRNAYIYYINRQRVIDAKNRKTALARYANDAKGIKSIRGLNNNCTYSIENNKVYIKAIRNIIPGSELLVSYGKEYWDVIKKNKVF